MDGSLAHRGGLPAWTAWALLGASAAPLAFVLVEAQRLLLGSGPAFLGSDVPPSTYLRTTYLLQVAQPDRVLLVALLGLAVAARLLRAGPVAPRPDLAHTCATVLAAVLAALSAGLLAAAAYLATGRPPDDESGFSPEDRLDTVGAPAAAGLVLMVLSVLLLRLVLADRAAAQAADDLADDDDLPDDGPVRLSRDDGAEPRPEPELAPEEPQRDDGVRVRLVEEPAPRTPGAAPDAHSVFRRPDAAPPRSAGSVPVAPALLADASAYRRPGSAGAVDEPADDPHAPYRRTSSSA